MYDKRYNVLRFIAYGPLYLTVFCRLFPRPLFIFAIVFKSFFKPGSIASFLPARRLLSLWLCLLTGSAFAQVSFVTVASTKDMGRTDYVQIQYKIENAKQIDNLQPPDFPDFNIIQGPSESTGMSIINGAVSQSKSVSFVLQPKHPGKFNIMGATATIDGNRMHSNTVSINVRDVNSYGNAQPLQQFSPLPDPGWPAAEPEVDVEEVLKPGENISEKIRKNFFIRVELNKKECYVGEPIVVTYKLYSRLHSDSRVTRHPSLNGFSVYDMIDPGDDHTSVEKVNGKNFRVHIIRKAQIIPLQAGDIPLDPVEIDNTIYFVRMDKGHPQSDPGGLGSLLDRFFDMGPRGIPVSQHLTLNSKPVTVHVKPLPDARRPVDFGGAVGRFSIGASVDSKEIDTGDAAILKVTVKGNGNLPMINAPTVEWPAEMESYDVSSKEDINKAIAPLGGSKTFSYSFTCTKTGKYSLPPIRFSYFDPAADTYRIVQTDPIPIQFNHARKHRSAPVALIPTRENGGWSSNLLWIAGGILIGGLGIYFLMRKNRDHQPVPVKIEPAPVTQPAAPVPVIDPLAETRALVSSGDYSRFYASVNRAVWKAVSDKLQLPASELNKFNISAGLGARGWNGEDILRLKSLLSECEMKLYTPEHSSADVERVMGEAEYIMSRLEG
jgi:hypothetical protein